MENVNFEDLGLSEGILSAITKKGFKVASEIQAKAIPVILEQKSDVIGIAQTGTGKTGAFGLPLIDLLEVGSKTPKAIVLVPTRELALQVTTEMISFCSRKKLNILTVYGGAPISTQMRALKSGTDIVVGTPGRVLDLLKRGVLVMKNCEHFVLDEADEMLKMGFVEDIEYILASASKSRRVYLFSATMPNRIKLLSKKYMHNQKIIEVKKTQEVNKLIRQVLYKLRQSEKFDGLVKLINIENFFYGIIFCRTKADVDNIANSLKELGHSVDAIHGDIQQSKRERILNKFRDLKINILVATDVAARGIDIGNLTHVINYNLPEDVETYTHRIGRTGRAGNSGVAISLVTPSEIRRISAIERTLKIKVESLKLPTEKEMSKLVHKKFIEEIREIIKTEDNSHHVEITSQLLREFDAEEIINAFLHKTLKKQAIKTKNSRSPNSSEKRFKTSRSGESRLFIAKGKMDKMDKRSLIKFIQDETRVRIGDVYDCKICEKFSFITLDSSEATRIVDAFTKKNSRRPLAEFAQN